VLVNDTIVGICQLKRQQLISTTSTLKLSLTNWQKIFPKVIGKQEFIALTNDMILKNQL